MSTSKFCESCGYKIGSDNRFCDECGAKITPLNHVGSDRSDDFLIGRIIEIINKNHRISYKEIVKMAGKTDRADRFVGRLENTNFFKIINEKDQFFLIKSNKSVDSSTRSGFDPNIIKSLEEFVKMGPILINAISGLMGISEHESRQLVDYLVTKKSKFYTILENNRNQFLSLK